jgi:hypothetical protein
MNQDLYSDISVAATVEAQQVTNALTGATVDLQGYESAVVIINAGTQSGTSFTPKVEESDESTQNFTDVTTSDLKGGDFPAITTANDEATFVRGYLGSKQYIRVSLSAATAADILISSDVVRGHIRKNWS